MTLPVGFFPALQGTAEEARVALGFAQSGRLLPDFTRADLQSALRLASPVYMAEFIRAPVLFVHGADDTLLPVEESERMAQKIKAAGGTAEVMVIPDGGRLFNFYQPEQAGRAWQATVDWFDRYLRPATRANR